MKFLNKTERLAVITVVGCGRQWGFGNMIDRLRKAWALHLKEKYPDFSWKTAFAGALFEGKELERLAKYAEENDVKVRKELKKYIGED